MNNEGQNSQQTFAGDGTTANNQPSTTPNFFVKNGASTTPNPVPAKAGDDQQINQPKKKSHLGLILAIVIPIILVLGGLAVWYFGFYNNKYSVVRNALYGLMQTRENTANFQFRATSDNEVVVVGGQLSYTNDNQLAGHISLSGKDDGKDVDFGSIHFAYNKDMYLKLQAGDTIKQFGVDLSSLNDQWFVVSASDLASASSLSITDADNDAVDPDDFQTCLTAANNELDSRISQQQLVDALIDTEFLIIDDNAKDKDGATIYSIRLDGNKYSEFANRIIGSGLYQTFTDCLNKKNIAIDDSLFTDRDMMADISEQINNSNPSIKLWIKGFKHQLIKMSLSATENGTTIETTIDLANEKPTIDTPDNAKSIQEFFMENIDLLTNSSNPSLITSTPGQTTINTSQTTYSNIL